MPFSGVTTAPHRPDDILEAAKERGLQSVVVVGRKEDGNLWCSSSTSDREHMLFLLELAKAKVMDGAS
jgi:hypothetical protein